MQLYIKEKVITDLTKIVKKNGGKSFKIIQFSETLGFRFPWIRCRSDLPVAMGFTKPTEPRELKGSAVGHKQAIPVVMGLGNTLRIQPTSSDETRNIFATGW